MTYLRAAWTVLWKSVVFLLLFAVLLAPGVVLYMVTLKDVVGDRRYLEQAYFDAVTCVALLAASWFMVRVIDRRPFVTLGFALAPAPRDLGVGIVVGLAWLMLAVAMLAALGCVSLPATMPDWPPNLGWVVVALVFNTVAQEALCRGYLFQTVRSRSNPVCAIMLTSLFFSALHVGAFRGAWLPAVNVFGAGVLLGVAYQLSGNLWLPIAGHFAWNFALGPVLGLVVSGQGTIADTGPRLLVDGPALLTGGPFGLEGGLATTAATAVVVVALFAWFRGARAAKRHALFSPTAEPTVGMVENTTQGIRR